MKSACRSAVLLSLALGAGLFLNTEAPAQGGLFARSGKVIALSEAGKYAEAIALAQAMVSELESSQPNSRDYAGALNNLAQLYGEVGRDAEAEPIYQRAIAVMEKAGGLDSADVAPELTNLAALYERQGRYAEAGPLFKRALSLWERARGPGNPDVGKALNNLATLYEREDRHADAEPLFRRALAIYQKAAGPENPAVATVLNNIGQVVKSEGRYADAEPPIRQSLAIREKLLGRDHPDVARSLNNLADLYERQGRPADAEPLYLRALPSASAPSAPIIPMSRPRKTISPRSIRARVARPTHCLWSKRRSQAAGRNTAARSP